MDPDISLASTTMGFFISSSICLSKGFNNKKAIRLTARNLRKNKDGCNHDGAENLVSFLYSIVAYTMPNIRHNTMNHTG
jgi:hypothetical protein